MTVALETSKVIYTGNGVTTAFPVTFDVDDVSHLKAYVYVIASRTLTLLTQGVDYTVSGIPGFGTVTYNPSGTPIPNTKQIIILRDVPLLQGLAIGTQGPFDAATLMAQLDLMVMQVQQLQEQIDRAIVAQLGDTPPNYDTFLNNVDATTANAAAAAASASAASTSATNAANSATAASGSATAAAGSATTASTQATNASNSATSASGSATTATTQATNAGTSATNASNSATQAATAAATASSPGMPYVFSTTTADADPGNGIFRLNNATIGSATTMFIDNQDSDAVSRTGLLDSFDDSTNTGKGTLTIQSKTTVGTRHWFRVTGSVVDGTGYRKLTLTYLGGSGALANAEACWISFTATGDKGTDGAGTGDVVGPASSTVDNIATYNATTGKLLKDSGVAVTSLAPKANATFTGTFDIAANSLALSRLVDSAAVSVLGRSANSAGARADIAAGSDDTVLRRVSSALGFGQLTANMFAAGIVGYAALASAAIASNSEFQLGTASKLLSAAALKSTVAYQALTDAASITWDMSLGNNGSVTLAGNRTLANPTNANPLFPFVVKVNASTSARTLDKGTNYVVAAGVESFPITIQTTETVFVVGFVDTTSRIVITGVVRT